MYEEIINAMDEETRKSFDYFLDDVQERQKQLNERIRRQNTMKISFCIMCAAIALFCVYFVRTTPPRETFTQAESLPKNVLVMYVDGKFVRPDGSNLSREEIMSIQKAFEPD